MEQSDVIGNKTPFPWTHIILHPTIYFHVH